MCSLIVPYFCYDSLTYLTFSFHLHYCDYVSFWTLSVTSIVGLHVVTLVLIYSDLPLCLLFCLLFLT